MPDSDFKKLTKDEIEALPPDIRKKVKERMKKAKERREGRPKVKPKPVKKDERRLVRPPRNKPEGTVGIAQEKQ